MKHSKYDDYNMTDYMDYSEMNIPDDAMESIARCFYPSMQAYYDSDEGQLAYAEYSASIFSTSCYN